MNKRTGKRFISDAFAALALSLSVLTSSGAQADTLADALVGAYNHSGLLAQNRALLRAADEDVAIAASVLKPIVNWSSNLTREFGDSIRAGSTVMTGGISATLQVFDFGADQTRTEAAKETVLATRATLLRIRAELGRP